jgi:hypothetical protein
MTDETRGTRTHVSPERGRRCRGAEHQLLRANAHSFPVAQHVHALDACATHLDSIARPEIFDRGALTGDPDPSVLTRHQRILDRHLTGSTSANYRIALRQIDLLQQKTEPEACQ